MGFCPRQGGAHVWWSCFFTLWLAWARPKPRLLPMALQQSYSRALEADMFGDRWSWGAWQDCPRWASHLPLARNRATDGRGLHGGIKKREKRSQYETELDSYLSDQEVKESRAAGQKSQTDRQVGGVKGGEEILVAQHSCECMCSDVAIAFHWRARCCFFKEKKQARNHFVLIVSYKLSRDHGAQGGKTLWKS